MRRFFISGLLVLFSFTHVYAWNLLQPIGGRTNALGKCSVALNDFWSLLNNPAGISSFNNISIGISYENRFLLKELGYKNVGLIIPLKTGTVGITASQFGYEHYNENIIGIAVARNFGPHLKIGLKLDYIYFKFSGDYDSFSSPTFELGIQYEINENLSLGTYLSNPTHFKIKSVNKDRIPTIMRLGFSYFIIDDFMITSEIEEDFEDNFSYRFGVEYKLNFDFVIRSGFQLNPELFTFGIGYNYNWCTVDFAGQMSQDLGVSVNGSIIFRIKDKR